MLPFPFHIQNGRRHHPRGRVSAIEAALPFVGNLLLASNSLPLLSSTLTSKKNLNLVCFGLLPDVFLLVPSPFSLHQSLSFKNIVSLQTSLLLGFPSAFPFPVSSLRQWNTRQFFFSNPNFVPFHPLSTLPSSSSLVDVYPCFSFPPCSSFPPSFFLPLCSKTPD